MTTLFRANHTFRLNEIKEFLQNQIRQIPNKIAYIGTPRMALRYEFPLEKIDPLSWLKAQNISSQIYWADRDGKFEMAAAGEADCVKASETALDYQQLFEYFSGQLSADNPYLRYYGGFCFEPSYLNSDWQEFGAYRFLIPRFEIFRDKSRYFFALNILLKDTDEKNINLILNQLEDIQFTLNYSEGGLPALKDRRDFPSREEWNKIFGNVQVKLDQGLLEKIVLARKSLFQFNESLAPMQVMEKLKKISSECFHFCFQTSPHQAFLGASPERLFKRTGLHIESEAIAGTKERGKTPEEDEQFKKELLGSSKNALEHKCVADFIKKQLTALCSELKSGPDLSLLKHRAGYHLMTRFDGILLEKSYDEEIFKALHPTPAVGGLPSKKIFEDIKALEPFQRGWYAGAMGYVGYDCVEFAVAIRSGLIQNNLLSLFAGAGIVPGSTAEEEWKEIENKIGSFTEVFK